MQGSDFVIASMTAGREGGARGAEDSTAPLRCTWDPRAPSHLRTFRAASSSCTGAARAPDLSPALAQTYAFCAVFLLCELLQPVSPRLLSLLIGEHG